MSREIKETIRKLYDVLRKKSMTHTHAIAYICDYIRSIGYDYKFQTIENIVLKNNK